MGIGSGPLAVWILRAQVFLSGAVVMAVEMLGGRVFAPSFGSSIYTWGALIGVVLTGLSAGAWLGGRQADRNPSGERFSWILLGGGLLAAGIPVAAPYVISFVEWTELGIDYAPLLAAFILMGPMSLVLGMVSPFAIRLAATELDRVGTHSGNLYAVSTAGSIAGTFVTVFLLIPAFRVPTLFALLGTLLVVAAFVTLRNRSAAVGVVGMLLLVSPLGQGVLQDIYTRGQLATGDVLYETETPYHSLVVAETYDPLAGGTVRQLIMDGLRHSSMIVDDPNETTYRYVQDFHAAFAWNPNATEVLMIGGGGFSWPKKVLEAYPHVNLTVVEIDPVVVEVAHKWFETPRDHPRLEIHVEDGRRFLDRTDQKYDLIVMDAYGRTYIPFHLMTQEFMGLAKDRLNPGGALVNNIIAATAGPASDLVKAEIRTLETVFPETYVLPVGGERKLLAQNLIVVAQETPGRRTVDELRAALPDAAREASPGLDEELGHLMRLDPGDAPVLTDAFTPVETLLNPITKQPYEVERWDPGDRDDGEA